MNNAVPHDNPPSPLLTLIDLGHRARVAANGDELAFLLVNETHRLQRYRQSALWFAEGGVRCLSGVVQVEANAPYVQWLKQLCQTLPGSDSDQRPQASVVEVDSLPAELRAQWDEWLPRQALWISLPASAEHPGSVAGGLLLAGDAEHDAGLANPTLYPLLEEWLHTWRHAWLAQFRPRPWSLSLWRTKTAAWWRGTSGRPWWRRRPPQIALLVTALLLCPVRLTVLAPGELVPAQPAVIRAPLDGVIAQFHVQPNAVVKAGQALFSFDEAPLASRLEVARYALSAAQTEYRQQAQMAVSDSKSKGQLAMSLGKIGEKQADADYLESQFQRSHVLAPQDGVVLFDDPSEWIGRPVQTGERIMKIAAPQDVEIEAWIAVGDAIPLPDAAPVSLYLAATPFDALSGQVRYLGHDALPRPDGNYAYRLRARLDNVSAQRVGLKGTVKVQGAWVPLVYWILRRPLALIRQIIAY
ncbi:secretion protein HylD [Herbaspirillum sp. meg3]|uniref:efflux RND transporter periplasmic adaptor subunit n=1 Tax=Herbaspirillum sp. meg3 TaxID=2025949 RepID=UPI000B98738E|nr:HlyD family efflux transporter periplasmic adaptor subunit [Herbaspirillum sp. meg3]ASU38892.1 secretion protein HylD [Herbaspirillum sp. meg3]